MGRYKPHQTTILIGVSLALSPAICLPAFYRVIHHALHRTIGTLLSHASFRQKEGFAKGPEQRNASNDLRTR
jgi:hypothetical protein